MEAIKLERGQCYRQGHIHGAVCEKERKIWRFAKQDTKQDKETPIGRRERDKLTNWQSNISSVFFGV